MPPGPHSLYNRSLDWRARLAHVVEMIRDMSLHSDPQDMVRNYGERVAELEAFDRYVSISRRGLERPFFRVTRDSEWKEAIDPWKERDRLPLLKGGLLSEIIYSNQPAVTDDLKIDPADPAAPYLDGYRTMIAVPHFDHGESLNMVVHLRRARGFDAEEVPTLVLESALFGRATYSLRLSAQLKEAYAELDRELAVVGEIQRSLLPESLGRIPGLDLAASYRTARRAGGDYYDVLDVGDGRWGIFIADVSGHGTPAAVMMAITHALVHARAEHRADPGGLLADLNARLARRYTRLGEAFVTAFYGVYDVAGPALVYARAGHPLPRLRRGGEVLALDGASGLPLGIDAGQRYESAEAPLRAGDLLALYTDGITEARSAGGEEFGVARLDAAILSAGGGGAAERTAQRVLDGVTEFTGGAMPEDDQTLLMGVVSGAA